jgi:hypothetical protein
MDRINAKAKCFAHSEVNQQVCKRRAYVQASRARRLNDRQGSIKLPNDQKEVEGVAFSILANSAHVQAENLLNWALPPGTHAVVLFRFYHRSVGIEFASLPGK